VVKESSLAHAGLVVAESQVVVGFSPAECLCSGHNGLLLLLGIVSDFAMLAPL